ncbi:MAG: 50S ribosomal protein L29 [Bacteroidia bacterium]|nr:50S ribosomal protein L29 [Bacteroidia bacterium]
MKTAEIKELTTPELKERIDDTKTLLVRLKFNHAVSPLENPMKIKKTRRIIARMKTEFKKRELNKK